MGDFQQRLLTYGKKALAICNDAKEKRETKEKGKPKPRGHEA